MFKIFTILLSLFVFIGQITLPVFAQTKVARKSTARKATSSSAKKTSGKTVRAATSSKSNIRSATGTRTSSASRTSSRARVDSRSNGGTIRNMGTGVSSGGSASGAANTNNCKSWYTECMDIQIANIISSYPYLADDPAVQSIQETGDPLRCIYYDNAKVEEIFGSDITGKYCSSDLMAKRQTVSIDDKTGNSSKDGIFNNLNFCSNQKNVNELYMAYNYYCDLDSSEVSALGMPINKCNIVGAKGDKKGKKSTLTIKKNDNNEVNNEDIDFAKSKNSVFATKDSMAYYAEANRRVENGELKIINFEKTNLFKNKISKMNLENWDMMSLDYEDTNDLLADLGLTADENELFSINVVPPVGAGNLNPAGVFKKASDICFSKANIKLAGKKATESESKLQTLVNQLAGCDGVESRADLERYYLAGTWRQDCPDGYYLDSLGNTCISLTDKSDTKEKYTAEQVAKGEAELMDTDFLSAKKSCDMYEQTLISTRNAEYGKFDTQLKNYIEDEVAKLIKRKTKDLNTIASAFQSLQQMDADISINLANMKADIANAKSEAEIAILSAELNLDTKKLEVDKQAIAQRKERAKMYLETYPREIIGACIPKTMASVQAVCGKNYTECIQGLDNFFVNLKQPKKLETLANMVNMQSIYMDVKGNVISANGCYEISQQEKCVKKADGSVISGLDTKDACENASGFYEWKTVEDKKEVEYSLCSTPQENTDKRYEQFALAEAPKGYVEIYCVDAPYFYDSILAPTRQGMGLLYDGILEYSCTGKNDALMRELEQLQLEAQQETSPDGSNSNNVGQFFGGLGAATAVGGAAVATGLGVGVATGLTTTAAITAISIPVAGWVVGGVLGTAALIGSLFVGSKDVSYENQRIENGKCVVTEKTTTTKAWGLSKKTDYETIVLPALKDHYMGKGIELFDKYVGSSFKSTDDLLGNNKK